MLIYWLHMSENLNLKARPKAAKLKSSLERHLVGQLGLLGVLFVSWLSMSDLEELQTSKTKGSQVRWYMACNPSFSGD